MFYKGVLKTETWCGIWFSYSSEGVDAGLVGSKAQTELLPRIPTLETWQLVTLVNDDMQDISVSTVTEYGLDD
jgi:hypothetical protein